MINDFVNKLGLQNKSMFPDILLAGGLCLVFSGYFFLDTSSHRVCLYFTLVLGMFFVHKNHAWREAFIIRDPLFLATIAFCVYAVISLLWSENLDTEKIWHGIKPAIFIILSISLYSFYLNKFPKVYTLAIELFLLSAFTTATILLILNISSIMNIEVQEHHIWRLEGFGRAVNSNLAGVLYGCALLCLLFLKPSILSIFNNKYLKFLCVSIISFALVLTMSRGAFTGAFGTLIVVFGVKGYSTKNIGIKPILITMFSAITLSLLMVFVFPDILSYMIDRGTTGRIEIWNIALEQFQNSPWIGRGIETKFIYDIPHPSMTISVGHAHSLYFSSLLHLGILGSIIFFTLLILSWVRAVKYTIRTQDYVLLILISFGYIFGLVDSGGYYKSLNNSWVVFWIPLAVLIADNKVNLNNQTRNT